MELFIVRQEFSNEIQKMLPKLRGANAYIIGDYNVDLHKAETHRPKADYLDGFYPGGSTPWSHFQLDGRKPALHLLII